MGEKKAPKLRFEGFDQDWEQRKLGDESDILAGGDVDKTRLKKFGKYPVLANALTNNGIVGYYDDYYRVEAPAVTVTGRGDVGHAKARKSNFTPVVRLLSVHSKHDVNFLENAINNHQVFIESTGVPQLTSPQLGNYKIFFPSINEEVKIGIFFKQLDDTIALHQHKLEQLKLLKQAFLQKMFVNQGYVPELRFAEFVEEWEKRKLGEILKVNSGKDYKHLNAGVVPVYGTGGYMLSVDDKLSDIDAIGIGRKGTIDKPQYLKSPFWTVDTLFFLTPLYDHRLNFILQFAYKITWKKYAEQTGVPSLSKASIENIEIKVPDTREQEKIGAFFKQLDDTIDLHQKKLTNLSQLKKAFLQFMFI